MVAVSYGYYHNGTVHQTKIELQKKKNEKHQKNKEEKGKERFFFHGKIQRLEIKIIKVSTFTKMVIYCCTPVLHLFRLPKVPALLFLYHLNLVVKSLRTRHTYGNVYS